MKNWSLFFPHTKKKTTTTRLQFEFAFRLHDFFDKSFGPSLFPWQGLNGANHLVIGFPLVLEIARARIIDVMLFGNAIQPVDAGISALQAFLQMGARPHVLVPRPMKFDACLGQPFLNVQSPTMHPTAAQRPRRAPAASSSPCDRVSAGLSLPTRCNRVDVST